MRKGNVLVEFFNFYLEDIKQWDIARINQTEEGWLEEGQPFIILDEEDLDRRRS
jgi:hypothetical protein